MTTTTSRRLGGLLCLLLAGCVGPVEIAPLPYAHPANPEAPAGRIPDVGSVLAPGAGDSPPAAATPMRHDMGGMRMTAGGHPGMEDSAPAAAAGKYQCPMHAGVRSDKPGKCPVCGMRLVEKKRGEEHGGHEE